MTLSLPILSGLLAMLAGSGQVEQQKPTPPKRKPGSGQKQERPLLTTLPDDYLRFSRVPDGGVLPEIARRDKELVLLYFKGEGERGDLFLARSRDEGVSFSPGLELTTGASTLLTKDGTHSGTVALGPDGRASVAWISTGETPTLWFARDLPEGGLGPIQNLGSPPGLCSTPALTVGMDGQISLVFAALSEGDDPEASLCRIWLRRSSDGMTFSDTVAIDKPDDGVSGRSDTTMLRDDAKGLILVFYREAHAKRPGGPLEYRGMRILHSIDGGQEFKSAYVDGWKQQRDPHSSALLFDGGDARFAVWNARGSVFWSLIGRRNKILFPSEVKTDEEGLWCSDPAGAANSNELLLAWLEQPPNKSAPARLAWKMTMFEAKQLLAKGYAEDPPGRSTPVAFSRGAAGFTILY